MTTATPRCPSCNTQGLKNLANMNLGRYDLIYCGHCGAIFGVVPNLDKLQAKIAATLPAAETPPDPVESKKAVSVPGNNVKTELLRVIGQADLTGKEPYDPAKMAARMKAAGMGRATQYRHYAIDDGPPTCLTHHSEMQRVQLPAGYRNSGRWFWICTEPGCQEWELAE